MRTLTFFIFFTYLLGSCAFCQEDILRLSEIKESVASIVSAQRTKNIDQVDIQELESLHKSLAGNRSNIWKMSDFELSALRTEVQPLRSLVFQLGESENRDHRFFGAVLASYLPPDAQTKNLLNLLSYDENGSTAGTALDTLFGMSWESPKTRGDIIASLEALLNGESSTMASMARNNAGDWGLVEAIPVLTDILEKEYNEKGKISSIITQLKKFGSSAASALPTIESLYQAVQKNPSSHPRELEALGFAKSVIKSEIKSGNGGKILERNTPEKRNSKPKESVSNNQETAISETNEPKSSTSSKWPYIVLGIALISILVILLRAAKRKGKGGENKSPRHREGRD